MNRRPFVAALPLLALAACSANKDSSLTTHVQGALNGYYDTPDPNNAWTQGVDLSSLAIGQETFLDDEESRFAQMARTVNDMQDRLADAQNGGTTMRGFHAKAHACVQGEFHVRVPDGLDARVGLFAQDATYPAWVRFSNGVGYSQADRHGDVRGLAIKVMKVSGTKILPGQEDAVTQDFLMTNGPITPAPDSQQFVDFGAATVDAAVTSSRARIIGPLEAMLETGGYLLNPRNTRVREYLIHHALPRVVTRGSMLSEQFWSGGAIALGLEAGDDTMHAKAKQAIKFTAIPGVMSDDGTCTPVSKLPNILDSDYFRSDIKERLKRGTSCIDFQIQFQRDPARQPLEDTSVEWLESETPFTSVGYLTIPATDLDADPVAQSAESFCNSLGFTPWHALVEHRPLGNIMRARRVVYEASRTHRSGAAEPTGDETFSSQ